MVNAKFVLIAILLAAQAAFAAAVASDFLCPSNPVPTYMDIIQDPPHDTVNVFVFNKTATYERVGMPSALVFQINQSDPNNLQICYGSTLPASDPKAGWATFPYDPEYNGCLDYWYVFCPGWQAADNGLNGQNARMKCLNGTGLAESTIKAPVSACDGASSGPLSPDYTSSLVSHNELYFCNQTPKDFAALCWPLMLIAGLLIGASFLLGKNPFMAFDMSAPRMGRGKQYAMRAQNRSVDFMSVAMGISQAAQSVASAVVAAKSEKVESESSGGGTGTGKEKTYTTVYNGPKIWQTLSQGGVFGLVQAGMTKLASAISKEPEKPTPGPTGALGGANQITKENITGNVTRKMELVLNRNAGSAQGFERIGGYDPRMMGGANAGLFASLFSGPNILGLFMIFKAKPWESSFTNLKDYNVGQLLGAIWKEIKRDFSGSFRSFGEAVKLILSIYSMAGTLSSYGKNLSAFGKEIGGGLGGTLNRWGKFDNMVVFKQISGLNKQSLGHLLGGAHNYTIGEVIGMIKNPGNLPYGLSYALAPFIEATKGRLEFMLTADKENLGTKIKLGEFVVVKQLNGEVLVYDKEGNRVEQNDAKFMDELSKTTSKGSELWQRLKSGDASALSDASLASRLGEKFAASNEFVAVSLDGSEIRQLSDKGDVNSVLSQMQEYDRVLKKNIDFIASASQGWDFAFGHTPSKDDRMIASELESKYGYKVGSTLEDISKGIESEDETVRKAAINQYNALIDGMGEEFKKKYGITQEAGEARMERMQQVFNAYENAGGEAGVRLNTLQIYSKMLGMEMSLSEDLKGSIERGGMNSNDSKIYLSALGYVSDVLSESQKTWGALANNAPGGPIDQLIQYQNANTEKQKEMVNIIKNDLAEQQQKMDELEKEGQKNSLEYNLAKDKQESLLYTSMLIENPILEDKKPEVIDKIKAAAITVDGEMYRSLTAKDAAATLLFTAITQGYDVKDAYKLVNAVEDPNLSNHAQNIIAKLQNALTQLDIQKLEERGLDRKDSDILINNGNKLLEAGLDLLNASNASSLEKLKDPNYVSSEELKFDATISSFQNKYSGVCREINSSTNMNGAYDDAVETLRSKPKDYDIMKDTYTVQVKTGETDGKPAYEPQMLTLEEINKKKVLDDPVSRLSLGISIEARNIENTDNLSKQWGDETSFDQFGGIQKNVNKSVDYYKSEYENFGNDPTKLYGIYATLKSASEAYKNAEHIAFTHTNTYADHMMFSGGYEWVFQPFYLNDPWSAHRQSMLGETQGIAPLGMLKQVFGAGYYGKTEMPLNSSNEVYSADPRAFEMQRNNLEEYLKLTPDQRENALHFKGLQERIVDPYYSDHGELDAQNSLTKSYLKSMQGSDMIKKDAYVKGVNNVVSEYDRFIRGFAGTKTEFELVKELDQQLKPENMNASLNQDYDNLRAKYKKL